MAYSKVGGTRAYLRGRVGADVYTIGRSAVGSKQQVVKARPETIRNVRSEAQQKNRMFMTTASQIAKQLQPLISHSFNYVRAGAPSIARFKSLLLEAMQRDAEKASPEFGYLPSGGRGCCQVEALQSDLVWKEAYKPFLSQYAGLTDPGTFPSLTITFPVTGRFTSGSNTYYRPSLDDLKQAFGHGDESSVITAWMLFVPVSGDVSKAVFKTAQLEFNPTFWSKVPHAVAYGYYFTGTHVGQYCKYSGFRMQNPTWPKVGGSIYLQSLPPVANYSLGYFDFPEMEGYLGYMGGLFLSCVEGGKRYIYATPIITRWGRSFHYVNGGPQAYIYPTDGTLDGHFPLAKSYADALATYPIGDAGYLDGGSV